jgi:hypothetical protein
MSTRGADARLRTGAHDGEFVLPGHDLRGRRQAPDLADLAALARRSVANIVAADSTRCDRVPYDIAHKRTEKRRGCLPPNGLASGRVG